MFLNCKLFSTVSGFFGGSQLSTTQDPVRPFKIMYDDIIITPPPFPTPDDPHWKPGTTNSGGVVQHVKETFNPNECHDPNISFKKDIV